MIKIDANLLPCFMKSMANNFPPFGSISVFPCKVTVSAVLLMLCWYLKLVSTIFYQIFISHQMIVFDISQKL